jgi:hypothetical protein
LKKTKTFWCKFSQNPCSFHPPAAKNEFQQPTTQKPRFNHKFSLDVVDMIDLRFPNVILFSSKEVMSPQHDKSTISISIAAINNIHVVN